MARVVLSRSECRKGALPALCIACGTPCADQKPERIDLGWMPLWAWCLFPLFPAIVFFQKWKRRIFVPLCRAHYRRRDHFVWYFFGIVLLLTGLGMLLSLALHHNLFSVVVMSAAIIAGLIASCFLVIRASVAFRVGSIDDESLTLVDVDHRFSDALRRQREQPGYGAMLAELPPNPDEWLDEEIER